MKKLKFLAFVLLLFGVISIGIFHITSKVSAQSQENLDSSQGMVTADEDLSARDLGIPEPKVLPDSPFYFLKEAARKVQSFFTFNPLSKAKLEMRFASERLLEAKKLFEKGKIDKGEKVLEKQEKDFEKARNFLEKKKNDPKIEKILDQMAERMLKHQKVLDALESKVPLKILPEIRRVKEKVAKSYLASDDPSRLEKRLREVLDKEKGSDFKEIKNLQVLERLKEFAPEEAVPAIEKAIEKQKEKIKVKLEKLPQDQQEKLPLYLSRMRGNRLGVLKVIKTLKNLEPSSKILDKIERVNDQKILELKEKILKAFKEKDNSFINDVLNELAKGDISKLEVIDDLEKEIPLKLLPKFLAAKRAGEERILKRIKNASAEEKNELLDKISSQATLKTLKILGEDINSFPSDKRLELEELKRRIEAKISGSFSDPQVFRNPRVLERKIRRFLGVSPDEKRIVTSLPLPSSVRDKMSEVLRNRLIEKFKSIKNPEEFEEMKREIEENKIKIQPEAISGFEKRVMGRITPEKVKEKIQKCEEMLTELEKKLTEMRNKISPEFSFKLNSVLSLKKLSEEQLNEAKMLLEKKEIGQAWAKATAALTKAEDALRILEKLKWLIEKGRFEIKEGKRTPEKGEKIYCTMEWNPVCGEDGKTYSNPCRAKAEGVRIKHKGECGKNFKIPPLLKPLKKETEKGEECKYLWWFDDKHSFCQKKKFCGLHMYKGLRVFADKEKCLRALDLLHSPLKPSSSSDLKIRDLKTRIRKTDEKSNIKIIQ